MPSSATSPPPDQSLERVCLPLSPGHSGPSVGELRRRLALLEHGTGPDHHDDYGPATAAAVSAFQDSRGLEPTGICDEATWTALLESEHRLGDRLVYLRSPMLRGEDIADLQLRLGTLGFDSGRVDGIFGPLTQCAVGDFQRNAGIVSDEVCGPDTVSALVRLAGRAGSSTLASVRERVRLQRGLTDLGTVRVALGTCDPTDQLLGTLAALLAPQCGEVAILDGDWSAQAAAANDFEADVYIGVEHTTGDAIEARFFSVPGFESYGGRSLAELVVRELPATGLGIVRGMRLPVLRETRSPAVVVKLGHGLGETHQRDLTATALSRALSAWAASTETSTST